MYKVVKIINAKEIELVELERWLNQGWRIHDKTATHDWIIYVLWIGPGHGSAGN